MGKDFLLNGQKLTLNFFCPRALRGNIHNTNISGGESYNTRKARGIFEADKARPVGRTRGFSGGHFLNGGHTKTISSDSPVQLKTLGGVFLRTRTNPETRKLAA